MKKYFFYLLSYLLIFYCGNLCASADFADTNNTIRAAASPAPDIDISDSGYLAQEAEEIKIQKESRARLKFHLANHHLSENRFDSAELSILEAINLAPLNEKYRIFYGDILLEQNRDREAIKQYLAVLISSPNNAAVSYKLGKIYIRLNMPEDALNYLINIFNEYSKSAEYLFYLANAYFSTGKYDNAAFYYNKCIELNAAQPSIYYNLGLSYYLAKQYDKAESAFIETINLYPEHIDAYLQLMQIYALTGNVEKADTTFNSFLTTNFSDEEQDDNEDIKKRDFLIFEAGQYFEENNKLSAASKAFENLHLKNPENLNVKFYLAKIYYFNGDSDSALPLFNEIIKTRPEMPEPHIFAGIIYQNKFSFGKAMESINRAAILRSDIPELWIMLAELYIKNLQNDSAITIIENAVNNLNLKSPDLYLIGAHLFSQKKDIDKIFFFYEKIINEFFESADGHIMNFVGYSYLEKNANLDTAFFLISKALEESADNPFYLDSLAWYYYLIKNYAKAAEVMNKINLTEISDSIIYEHYGDILSALEKKNESIEWYAKSLKIEERDAVKKKLEKLSGKN